MYAWTLLTTNIGETPYLMGITDDLDKAKRIGEPHLISGRAFLCHIAAVRAAISVHGLDTCYIRTGHHWFGRCTIKHRVKWCERDTWPW
jgi:hypothetical protein